SKWFKCKFLSVVNNRVVNKMECSCNKMNCTCCNLDKKSKIKVSLDIICSAMKRFMPVNNQIIRIKDKFSEIATVAKSKYFSDMKLISRNIMDARYEQPTIELTWNEFKGRVGFLYFDPVECSCFWTWILRVNFIQEIMHRIHKIRFENCKTILKNIQRIRDNIFFKSIGDDDDDDDDDGNEEEGEEEEDDDDDENMEEEEEEEEEHNDIEKCGYFPRYDKFISTMNNSSNNKQNNPFKKGRSRKSNIYNEYKTSQFIENNFFKTSDTEYIALSKMDNLLKNAEYNMYIELHNHTKFGVEIFARQKFDDVS
ncbi:unnamed protein product, partial [marine sediment metagenome]